MELLTIYIKNMNECLDIEDQACIKFIFIYFLDKQFRCTSFSSVIVFSTRDLMTISIKYEIILKIETYYYAK